MQARINYREVAPDAFRAMLEFHGYVRKTGLGDAFLDLLCTYVSLLNGCAHCIDMHSQDARRRGETEQRIYALTVWRETPFFSERERAAFGYAEAVTKLADGVSDEVFAEVRKHFSDKEVVELTVAIADINAWNRIGIAMRIVPGTAARAHT